MWVRLVCSGFQLEKISLWLGCAPGSIAGYANTPELGGKIEVIYFVHKCTMWAGLGKNSCLCYSSVSLGLSGGTGELPSNMAHCMAGQSVLAVDVGFSQRTPFLTQTSLWGCLPLLPQSMTTRNEHFNWQEVDTASSLKPGPRSCHNMISVIFCCSHSDKSLLRYKCRGCGPQCHVMRGMSSVANHGILSL